MRLEFYKENINSINELRDIFKGYYLMTGIDPNLYVRGTFKDTKTGDLIFGYGSWLKVELIGYKHITLHVDNNICKCEIIEKFDIKI